ncbi:MAG: alpha/beta fold hydrolase [Planctomycetota bacterium]|jgi:acetyl esterase/lipase
MLSSVLMVTCLAAAQAPAEFQVELREKIVYSKVDDRELLLDAYVPEKKEASPAVLVVHGGAWRSGNRRQLKGYAQSLAKMGFVCFAIDYRLAPQYKWPAQIDDCRTAVKWIRKNAKAYNVNSKKLGAIGYSAGGHLVSLLGTTGEAPTPKNGNIDTRIQAVVAGGAPTDFRWFPDNGKWAEFLFGGDLEKERDKFNSASSAAFVDKNDAPTFFFNGTKDRLVPLPWTESCFKAMQKAGVKTELHRIEGAGHMLAAMNYDALQMGYAFLRVELLGETPTKQPEPNEQSRPEQPKPKTE